MTPPAPARLTILFAPQAPIAVIYRRGPSHWTQMWLWKTDTDEFMPGQWIKGYVHEDSTLSPDGRYVISRVMSGDQHTVLSRPPFFSALAVTVDTLCVTGAWFLANGSVRGRFNEIRVPGCPLRIETEGQAGVSGVVNSPLESANGWAFGSDPQGRKIAVHEGRIGVVDAGEARWLIDLNPSVPTNIPPPTWALDW